MNFPDRQYIIGMAGHIDHGKTALVKALTGVDTDRLKEEKERGITTDLGFAHLSKNVTIIDVPGHERLIKNMVAGVSTIDLVLFVIAADDGIMPQTREHLDIVQLLGISHGIFAITKIDLVENEWVDRLENEIKTLLQGSSLEGSPIVRTSILNEASIRNLHNIIVNSLQQLTLRKHDGLFRMPIDRAFSKVGFGSVVTGSVISGEAQTGDLVEILPEKFSARIRALQSHDTTVPKVETGYRAAINLAGVELAQLHRGQMLTAPGYYQPVDSFLARIKVLNDTPVSLKNNMRIRLHLHTAEVIGRVILFNSRSLQGGESDYAYFRLENQMYASYGDRFIIRQFSPLLTIGGGIVLQTSPGKFFKRQISEIINRLQGLEDSSPMVRILACFSTIDLRPLTIKEIQVKTGLSREQILQVLQNLIQTQQVFHFTRHKEDLYLNHIQVQKIQSELFNVLNDYHKHHPGRPGILLPELSGSLSKNFSDDVIRLAIEQGIKNNTFRVNHDIISAAHFHYQVSDQEKVLFEEMDHLYWQSGFQPPLTNEVAEKLNIPEKTLREMLNRLREQGQLIFVDEKLFFHRKTIEKLLVMLREYFSRQRELSVADFKNMTNTTRKFAIPLLSYLDRQGFTERRGDLRIVGEKLEIPAQKKDSL